MNRFVKVVLALVFALFIIFEFISFVVFWFFTGISDTDSYDDAINIINSFSTDIIVYGESINFRSTLDYREIESLSEEHIFEQEFEYTFLIVNDLSSNAILNDNDIMNIINLLNSENNKLSFFYLGTSKIERMSDLGLFDCATNFDFTLSDFTEEDLGFSLEFEKGYLVPTVGFWTIESQSSYKEDNELLDKSVLWRIQAILKANY